MNKIKTTSRFILRHWFGILCFTFVLYMCFGGEYSLKNIVALHSQEAALRKEIEEYKDSISNFERRIVRMRLLLGLFYCVTAYFMFKGGMEWLPFLCIAVVIELYTLFVISKTETDD